MAKADLDQSLLAAGAQPTLSRRGRSLFASSDASVIRSSPKGLRAVPETDFSQPGISEVIAMFAGARGGFDCPEKICPTIFAFLVQTNNFFDQADRLRLWPFARRLAYSKSSVPAEQERIYRLADWAIREVLPLAFAAEKQVIAVGILKRLEPLVSRESAKPAQLALEEIAGFPDLSESARRALCDGTSALKFSLEAVEAIGAGPMLFKTKIFAAAHYAGFAAKVDRQLLVQARLGLLEEFCLEIPE